MRVLAPGGLIAAYGPLPMLSVDCRCVVEQRKSLERISRLCAAWTASSEGSDVPERVDPG